MELDREIFKRAELFLESHIRDKVFNLEVIPHWIDRGDEFWYRHDQPGGHRFIKVIPKEKRTEPAFDHSKVSQALCSQLGICFPATALPFKEFEWLDEHHAIQFRLNNALWHCDLTTYICSKLKSTSECPSGYLASPNEMWHLCLKGSNLYLSTANHYQEWALTQDGERHYAYANSPQANLSFITNLRECAIQSPVGIWSANSEKFLTHRLDERRVNSLSLIQAVPTDGAAHPRTYSYRMPFVGEEIASTSLIIIDVARKTLKKIDTAPLLAEFLSPIELGWVWWGPDDKEIYFLQESRGAKELNLCAANAQSGKCRTIITESSSTYVEPSPLLPWRSQVKVLSTEEIIWPSSRDGWNHFYLYDGKTGSLINQITHGPWIVREPLFIDEKERWLYFLASGREPGRDPYYKHLYRIMFDGTHLELLTEEDADHKIAFSPTGDYFIDNFSRIDSIPMSILKKANGEELLHLETADLSWLAALGWNPPTTFSVKARDGVTDLYGCIYYPSNFDPANKYPVVDDIYPGPQLIRTPKSFIVDSSSFENWPGPWLSQSIAELGFIVVNLDCLGSPLRSRDFHHFSYGKLEDAGLEDHVAALKQLAQRYPFFDLQRVGIRGHSAGGYAAARAILTYPDFYKVAVSSSGNHDQLSYLAYWGEKYQGLLQEGNYAHQANSAIAGNLKGKLLLVHGELDDNVHPCQLMRFVKALIDANKRFDMLFMPGLNHTLYNEPYYIRKMWDYFLMHL